MLLLRCESLRGRLAERLPLARAFADEGADLGSLAILAPEAGSAVRPLQHRASEVAVHRGKVLAHPRRQAVEDERARPVAAMGAIGRDRRFECPLVRQKEVAGSLRCPYNVL